MNRLIANLSNLIDSEQKNKSAYSSLLQDAEKDVIQHLVDAGYYQFVDGRYHRLAESPSLANLFDVHEQAEIAASNNQRIRENAFVGLESWARSAKKMVEAYLDEVNIGFLDEFELDDSYFKVSIQCMINPPISICGSVDDCAEKFNRQIQTLEQMGLVICPNALADDMFSLMFTLDNIRILKEALTSLGAQEISFKIDEYIEAITFVVPSVSIVNFNRKECSPISEVTNILTETEFNHISKDTSSFIEAINYIPIANDEMKNVCYHLVELCFSSICSIVGYKGTIVSMVQEQHLDEKMAMKKLNELSQKMSDSFDGNLAGSAYRALKHNLNRYVYENFGCSVNNLQIATECYGFTTAVMQFVSDPMSNCIRRRQFDADFIADQSRLEIAMINKSFFLKNTAANIDYIVNKLYECGIKVLGIDIVPISGYNDFCVHSIRIAITNISRFL